ncbi:Flp family type IVb pilin [Acetohalobium arabaticum]|uniref:Flp/Fap pilin component n=1 Tax=Acetohalobium arabaticum (strain ATCC 49924 / DSM 5501 / Z-7288) TaxID=574087 RepID=D9QTL5_ACEAZ|nr:Flp family type IVb pilin [Acetohalobium arabaticum]ADL11779.1 Flp/Fap pilin component [Acetohalobium arabaticum DSM 5501]
MLNILKRLLTEEDGQGMVEYGLILALIAVAVVAALTTMGEDLTTLFENITDDLGVGGGGSDG